MHLVDPVHLKVHLFQPFGEHGTHAASYSSLPVPRPFLEPFSSTVVMLFPIHFLSLELFFAASCGHRGFLFIIFGVVYILIAICVYAYT